MEKKSKIEELLEGMCAFTDEQLFLLNDFERRLEATMEHKQLIGPLAKNTRKLIKTENLAVLEDIHPITNKIKMDINTHFNKLLQDAQDFQQKTVESGQYTSLTTNVFEEDFKAIRDGSLHLENSRVKQKLERLSSDFLHAIKKARQLKSLNEYLTSISKEFEQIISQEKEILERELRELKEYDLTELNERKKSNLQRALAIIARCIVDLEKLLQREAIKIRYPLRRVLKEKKDLEKQVEYLVILKYGLLRTRKITAADLRKDFQRFLRPQEAQYYLTKLSAISPEFFERNALTYKEMKERALPEIINQTEERLSAMAEEAKIDALTKLSNRRAYEEKVAELIINSLRNPVHFSLLMVDIDRFKLFNEIYSHAEADRVLKKFANVLKNAVRKIDFVYRQGGEEFVILFPLTPLDKAEAIAERIKNIMIEETTPFMREELNKKKGSYPLKKPFEITSKEAEDVIERKNFSYLMECISLSGVLISFNAPRPAGKRIITEKEVQDIASELWAKVTEHVKEAKTRRNTIVIIRE